MTGPVISVLCFLFASLTFVESFLGQLSTENVLINVTTETLSDAQLRNTSILQINLNISVNDERVLVNDIPVELSGVTRLNCQALLLDSFNGSSELESGELVSTVTRVMVNQNHLYSDSEAVVALQVFSEVIELEGKEVQQPDMCEVKLLMSPDFQKIAQFTNIYPIGHSELSKAPRENDVVVTDLPSHKKGEEHTTSQYWLEQSETTEEKVAEPGKLPETPLRMDPSLLQENQYLERPEDIGTQGSSDEFLSYSSMCRWLEDTRERLRLFCSESLPLFFLVMWVVVIGVVGSAVIVKILDMFFPACEHKKNLNINPITLMPEDEKQVLLENAEIEEDPNTP